MRVAVVTLGSAGDLHPFLAVARALHERGHDVHLLTQAPYEEAARAEGLEFQAIADSAVHERTLHHPLLWHPMHGFGVLWRHLAVPAIQHTLDALDSLSQDGAAPLAVLASPLAVGARLARERWPERIRLLSGYTAPMGLRSCEDPMFVGRWRVPRWVPTSARRGLWWLLDRQKLEPMARPALMRWTSQLALAAPQGSIFGDWVHSPDGGMALYSEQFAPVPRYWQARGVHQVGFPVFEASDRHALAPHVSEFIGSERPYVVIYPGSADQRAQHFVERVLPACQAMSLRVLVLSRFRAQGVNDINEVLWIDEAPLPLVLGRAHAFIHHGGIGSVAQGLAAKVPQLVLASAYDQFENGARLEQMARGWSGGLDTASAHDIHVALQATSTIRPTAASWPGSIQPSRPAAPNAAVRNACDLVERLVRKAAAVQLSESSVESGPAG